MATLVGGKRQGDYAMGDKVSRFFVSCVIGSGGGDQGGKYISIHVTKKNIKMNVLQSVLPQNVLHFWGSRGEKNIDKGIG